MTFRAGAAVNMSKLPYDQSACLTQKRVWREDAVWVSCLLFGSAAACCTWPGPHRNSSRQSPGSRLRMNPKGRGGLASRRCP